MARARVARHPRHQKPLVSRTPPKGRLGKLLVYLRPPRRLKLTREGKYFIGITFGVGFAAINTGNNLLYLLLGMLLSLIVVSGVMSELSLRHLTVARRLPPRAQVGRPHLVEIEVYNHKKRVPSYANMGQIAPDESLASCQAAARERTPRDHGHALIAAEGQHAP